MTKEEILEAEELWNDDYNFQVLRANQRVRKRWIDPPRLTWPELQEARRILDPDGENSERLLESGVEATRPRARARIAETSENEADRTILAAGEANWSAAEKMSRLQPVNEAKLRPEIANPATKVTGSSESLSDEEILSAGSKNWKMAQELGNNQYAMPAIEESDSGGEDSSDDSFFEEDFEEDFEPEYEGILEESARNEKIKVLDRRITRLSKAAMAGDESDRLRVSDLVEDLKAQRLVLSGEWSE